jgi:hypothetical protein
MLLRGAFYRIGAVPAMWDANGRNEKPARNARIVHVPGICLEWPDLPVLQSVVCGPALSA